MCYTVCSVLIRHAISGEVSLDFMNPAVFLLVAKEELPKAIKIQRRY